MIEVKTTWKGSKEFEEGLTRLTARALPYAAKELLNTAAHATDIYWRAQIDTKFQHKDSRQWIQRSIRVERARGSDIRSMRAVVGALADRAPLLATEEDGGTVHGKGAHLPIPAPGAAGQPPGTARTKRVMGSRLLGAITVQRRPGGKSRHQANAIAMAQAKRRGQKFAILIRPSGGKGLFLIQGGKRRLRARLVWDLSKPSVHIRPHETLGPALQQTERLLPALADSSIQSQLRYQRIGK